MPIGAAKLGVLGAGLVPGGTETFNAPGTFSIPPGVKKVSITGRGGTGNPGVAGNPGNPGNIGIGAPGGQGGFARNPGFPPAQLSVTPVGGAGLAMKGTSFAIPTLPNNAVVVENNNLPAPQKLTDRIISFTCSSSFVPVSGITGPSGNAGNAGNAGNPGNTGQSSSGLGNTFLGGAGGNAGVAGAAGNGGAGGNGGTAGQPTMNNNNANFVSQGGSGGNGAGSGGQGASGGQLNTVPQITYCPSPSDGPAWAKTGGSGGGGAGATNDGQSGANSRLARGTVFLQYNAPSHQGSVFSAGGSDANTGWPAPTTYYNCTYFAYKRPPGNTIGPQDLVTNNMIGGVGGVFTAPAIRVSGAITHTFAGANTGPLGAGIAGGRLNNCYNLKPSANPYCTSNNNMFRAGAGGGAGTAFRYTGSCPVPINQNTPQLYATGGGGGGGRGNAGNAGGTSPTPTGAVATPATFNCVPVTPGGTAPITVASPGGQIVISWNPQ